MKRNTIRTRLQAWSLCGHLYPLRPAVLALALAGAVSVSIPVHAQARQIHFEIPAQDVQSALRAFAAQSGQQVLFNSDELTGQKSTALSGMWSPQQALEQLLTGLNIEVINGDGGTLVLRRRGVTALDRVTVAGAAQTSTENTGSYTTAAAAAGTGLTLALREIPQSVSVLTRQTMDDQNLNTVQEALHAVTGISQVQWDTKRAYIYSRGFVVNNLQYDGVLTEGSGGGMGDTDDLIFFDRVEVVRGATGLLSGSGEPSASINLIRKRPDSKELRGIVTAAAGSWDNYRTSADLSMPLNETGSLRGRVIGMAQTRHSFIDLYHNRKQAFYAMVEADLGDRTRLGLGTDYQSDRPSGVTWGGLPVIFSDGGKTDWSRSKTTAADWTRWYTDNRSVFADLEHEFTNGWRIKGHVTHREMEYDTRLLYLLGSLDRDTGQGLMAYPYRADSHFRQNSADVQLTGDFQAGGRKHEFVAGLSASHYRQRLVEYAGPGYVGLDGSFYDWDGSYPEYAWGGTSPATQTRIRKSGAYAALRLSLADPLTLIVGGRQSRWKAETATVNNRVNEFVPYVGLVANLNDVYSAYASYTEIFEPQDERDRSGAYLDPKMGKSYEIGLKGEHAGGLLNSSLAFFMIEQDNVAERDGDYRVPGSSDYAYVGVKGVKSRGFEAQLDGEVAPGWQVSLGISRTLSRQADGTPVRREVPTTMVHLGTSYRLQGDLQGLTVGGSLNWQNRTYADLSSGGRTVRFEHPSFTLLNLMARYELTPAWSAQLNVNNVFDKKYYVHFNGSGTYGAPRNVMLTSSYRF